MAANATMEGTTILPSSSDIELRVARIADPSIELKTRCQVASEIREMLEVLRDAEAARALPTMVGVVVDVLQQGEPSMQKESLQHQFRRTLLEVLNRCPINENLRSTAPRVFSAMVSLIRSDNEDDGVLCCKIMVDVARSYRCMEEDHMKEVIALYLEILGNMKGMVEEVLSPDSKPVDTNVSFPALRSFRVLAEIGLVMALFSQFNRNSIIPIVQPTIAPAFEVLELEAPAQKTAREDQEAMGDFWSGVASTVRNTSLFSDFLFTQVKILSYLYYVLRLSSEQPSDSNGERLMLASLRILQDCPSHAIGLRKDLLVVLRHLLTTSHRRALLPHLDKLLDERVLFGESVATKEILRAPVYGAVCDFFHHTRSELTVPQLVRILHVYSKLIHDPVCGTSLHTLFAKVMFGLGDAIITKDTSPTAIQTLEALFATTVDRLEALSIAHEEIRASMERNKNAQPLLVDAMFIEKSKPILGASYAVEKHEDVLHESRMLFRTLLHGFRVILNGLKKAETSISDGTLFFRLFEGCIRCMGLYDSDPRANEPNDNVVDWFTPLLLDVNLHVFQEVWTHKIDFFFECAQKRIVLLNICQMLFGKEATSPTILAIILRFLVDRLPLLGEYDDLRAAATIRLFKMAFSAVTTHSALNEPILASHLAKLLMDCFSLAAKATKPTHYLHLLRALFRAIGGGGGRFEQLYKEVLPLLPEMLDALNRHLLASEGQTRDMVVELCLTVPLRLTHLLPHLSYLMQPLALALRGTPDLVVQGLRTLELCIDNLTPDFLDPTLSMVLRELMEALHGHLKPLPANHHVAHTTIRILGKLGGRNRRLLDRPPSLPYHDRSEGVKLAVAFGGSVGKVELDAVCTLACRSVTKGTPSDIMHAYNFLEASVAIVLHEGVKGRNKQEYLLRAVEGLFDATMIPQVREQAEKYLHALARHIFDAEVRRPNPVRDSSSRVAPSEALTAFLDAWPHALARDKTEDASAANALIGSIIDDLLDLIKSGRMSLQDAMPLLHQITSRFTALCLDDPWTRKRAGCGGIKIMTRVPDIGNQWVKSREVDLVRTLLHILKDLPSDVSRDINEVVEVLKCVLRISNVDLPTSSESTVPNKLIALVGVFFPELQSSNPVVREVAQSCIALLTELGGTTTADLLKHHRDRILSGIFTKPLRALPFPIQIGMIEAVRYCVSLDPPVVDLSEELLRLLHETLALADAEDSAFITRNSSRQSLMDITKLRVACIKLLTASMPLTDFFSRQHATRQRVTGVYFKSLYSPSQEVKDVAHEGLRMVLTHQSRLPKELLQTGLRPILMNLADPKRLSVPGLEGLARLLELLTNYFKVEIGHKLLDHFRIVADPQMLQNSSRLPLAENEGITKLVRLANIFHLLPSTANIFLENLVNAIVQTEAQMHFSGPSPFSEPLAKYLNRYPSDGVDFFLRHLQFPRHLRTLRSILQAQLAPNLSREITSRSRDIISICLRGSEPILVLPALLLFRDMTLASSGWITTNDHVIDALRGVWISHSATLNPHDAMQRHSLILSIFKIALEEACRIDLLFDMISIYTRDVEMDLMQTTHFLYRHVALSSNSMFRRNVLMRFLAWFRDSASSSWAEKASFIRYIVTPTLVVSATRSESHLPGHDFVEGIHRAVWRRTAEGDGFAAAPDRFKIDILHLTIALVQHYPALLENYQKDIMKGAWNYISSSEDALVRQSAFLLTARFFAVFPSPPKFILHAWTGLLRFPAPEGRTPLRSEALAVLAPSLHKSESQESGYPQWANTARRLATDDSNQAMVLYQLMVKQPDLFFPVRGLFVPHLVNFLPKLGLPSTTGIDTRLMTIELLNVIFEWETRASKQDPSSAGGSTVPKADHGWTTPLTFRESIVSYLVRLVTQVHDPAGRTLIVPKALNLLQVMIGPNGWSDVAFGLRYFARSLEAVELNTEQAVAAALASAKVLQIIAAEQSDSWYTKEATTLQKLIRKGLTIDDYALHDALHPIFDRLIRLFPLPKEDEDQQGDMSDFHSWIFSTIGDGLRNTSTLRAVLLMLKSVVKVTPERIEPFCLSFIKLYSKLIKDHNAMPTSNAGYDNIPRLLIMMLDICQISMAFLGDQRRQFLAGLPHISQSKSPLLLRYVLDMARNWALVKQESYPTMKDKAALLQSMVVYEQKAEPLAQGYLQLIYDIYMEPSLRRSDLTSRLEHPFLLGCRAKDPVLRERFMDLLDISVPRSLFSRLVYICGVQNWEGLADQNWIFIALHLVLGSSEMDVSTRLYQDEAESQELSVPRPKTQSIVRPMQRLVFLDPQSAHDLWVSLFPAAWKCLSRREQAHVTHHMINLLSREYHLKQAEVRPNVIQTLLAGIHACMPPMTLPPHLVKYLSKNFGAWHIGLEILEATFDHVKDDEMTVRDYVYDSLADVYADLGEEDVFYGLWRNRCLYSETNVAIAFEQNGMWEQASVAYETAQTKARTGAIAFSEPEYCLWEDHWILSSEKLQQWDILYELGKNEGNIELMLESAWRTRDWGENPSEYDEHIKKMPAVSTPRRKVFEAYVALSRTPGALEKNVEFTRTLEDAMQLSLHKWVALPPHLSSAHVPLLQHFQQFVELQEAVQIFGSLSQTTAANLEKKSSELKMVLQAWRERLPNHHDDISIWSDLLGWRQNVFHSINRTYIPLLQSSSGGATSNSSNTYGYRGYHETAWIINRFAHVARKHHLLDACFTSLAKIYTLPNIEISEAFLKLREQARCYYQRPNDLQAGLEVINNTNLAYFSTSQKAEFYTLKGMFHARAGRNEDANLAFGQAVQLDMHQAKAWAEWGRWNDRMFKEHPDVLSHAANAVQCYLQAAGLYKNGKARPLQARILWLLSLDDASFTVSRAFDQYKGEAAFWFWISLIPQLCSSLAHREMKQARYLLITIARHYPQALFFCLRTTREEMRLHTKQIAASNRMAFSHNAPAMAVDTARRPEAGDSAGSTEGANNTQLDHTDQRSASTASSEARTTMEYVEEIVNILKTAFPLLILSMETMVDQISTRFKPSSDEDIYRHIGMLLQEASQSYLVRMNLAEDRDKLSDNTAQTLARVAQNLTGQVKRDYEDDFINRELTHSDYITRLQHWRDKYERILDLRPRLQPLDSLSHYLTEFQYNKVDEIEVPGQYTEEKDSNQNFVRIQKFAPKFENCRGHGSTWKRITMLGHDNSKTSFSVQLPCHRQTRREEKAMQLLRTFNGALSRKKESRKRNLAFHLPVSVSCGPTLRLLQSDASYISLADVYDHHCEASGMSREHPMLFSGQKISQVLQEFRKSAPKESTKSPTKTEYISLKKDICDEVALKFVPDDVLMKYMMETMDGPSELWRMRKQFGSQLAAVSFMTYVLPLASRHPARFHISRSTGRIAMVDILPCVLPAPSNAAPNQQAPVFITNDVVPFRFTPNMQRFLGPIFTEGVLATGIFAIARGLTEPEFDLEQQLALFIRDEVTQWLTSRGRSPDMILRQYVGSAMNLIIQRAELMACKMEREEALQGKAMTQPVMQTVINLISTATNPIQLAKMGELYYPWF